jgi:hypothetical protein
LGGNPAIGAALLETEPGHSGIFPAQKKILVDCLPAGGDE